MESRKYCAYNKTQASFLSLGITVVDTVNERAHGQIETLARNAPSGLWLNPCRDLPAGRGLPDFDVVYLDEDLQVIAVAESSPDAASEPPKPSAASALALPSHTIASSQTKCGDELIIWTTEGMGQKAAQSSKLVTHALMRFAPSPAREDTAKPQPASERSVDREKTEPEVKPSLMSRLKGWTSGKRSHRDADTFLSIVPASSISARRESAPVAPEAVTPAPVTPTPVAQVPVAFAPVTSELVNPAVAPAAVRSAPFTPPRVAPVRSTPSPLTSTPFTQAAAAPPPVRPVPVTSAPVRRVPSTAQPVAPVAATPAPVRPDPGSTASVNAPAITSAPAKSTPIRPEAITPVPSAPVTPKIESRVVKQPPPPAGFTLSRAADSTAKPPVAGERLEDKGRAESESFAKPSFKTRYEIWAAERAARRAADTPLSIAPTQLPPSPIAPDSTAAPARPVSVTPAPARPAPVSPSTEFVVPERPSVPPPVGFTLSRAADSAAKPPAVIDRSDAGEEADSALPEKPSLISRYKIWAAERAAGQAADLPISIAPRPEIPAPTVPSPVTPVRVTPVPITSAPARPDPATPSRVEPAPVTQITESPVANQPAATPAPVAPLPFMPSSESLFSKHSAVEKVPTSPLARPVPAKPPAAIEPVAESVEAEPEPEEKPSLKIRFLRWLSAPRTAAKRQTKPGLVAFYWTGGAPQPHEVVNISATGLYLRTREHWLPDTVILMTLQKIGGNPDNPEDTLSVLSKVVRQDDEGSGFEFVTSDSAKLTGSQYLPGQGRDKDALQRFLRRMKSWEQDV